MTPGPKVTALAAAGALAGGTLTAVAAVRPALPELRYRLTAEPPEDFSLGWEWYRLLLTPGARWRTLSLSADALVLFICAAVILKRSV